MVFDTLCHLHLLGECKHSLAIKPVIFEFCFTKSLSRWNMPGIMSFDCQILWDNLRVLLGEKKKKRMTLLLQSLIIIH